MAVTPARRAVPDVRPIFLDTAYINALVNTRDQWHEAASRWEGQLAVARRRLITTEFILIEIADGLSAVRFRHDAVRVIDLLRMSPLVEIVAASSQLFAAALDLYQRRADKDWGLTYTAAPSPMSSSRSITTSPLRIA